MFKKQLSVALALLVFASSSFAGTPLVRGTQVPVRLTAGVNTKKADQPSAIVESDVVDRAGKVLIRKGTPVELRYSRTKARGCGRPGAYDLKFVSVQSADGQRVALEGSLSDEGANRKGLAIGLGVGLGWFVWPCLFILCKKGGEATLPAGTLATNVSVALDYNVE